MSKKNDDFAAVRALHQTGKLDEAEQGYLALLSYTPNDAELLHSIGMVYTQKKQFDKARPYLENAIKENPNDPSIALNLANILKIQGLYNKARALLEKTIQHHPHYPPAWNNLGNILFAENKWDSARNAYQKSIEIYPGYVDAYYNLGLTYTKQLKNNDAIKTFQKLLTVSEDHLAARFHLACLYMQMNDFQNAIREFLIIETTQPFHFETQTNLATCYLKEGRLYDAKKYYLKAFELQSDDTQILFNLGVICTQLGQLDEAIQFYQQVLIIKPDDFATHNNLAIAFLSKNHVSYALKHLKDALRIQPNNKSLQYTIQSLAENRSLLAAPSDYIQSLFDAYADHYDIHLTKALEYQIPELFEKILKSSSFQTILDLGCGTGLCGEKFKKYTHQLIGVDLSEKMLDVARHKNIYDTLIQDDIEHYLKNNLSQFDLMIAGDVFVYTGNLDNIFSAIVNALTSHGLIVFNAEINEQNDFHLNQSGRFSHSKTYIDNLAKIHSLKVLYYQKHLTRMQNNEPVYGHIYVMEKELA